MSSVNDEGIPMAGCAFLRSLQVLAGKHPTLSAVYAQDGIWTRRLSLQRAEGVIGLGMYLFHQL